MRRRSRENIVLVFAFALVVCGFRRSAVAGTMLYDNGPITDTSMAGWSINNIVVTNSFELTAASTLSEIHLALATGEDCTPFSLNWAIGSAPFGKELVSGSDAPISSTFYPTQSETFQFGGTSTASTVPAPSSFVLLASLGSIVFECRAFRRR